MLGLPVGFANPLLLIPLLTLPFIWLLLRSTPPKPRRELFPPFHILRQLINRKETATTSPWWLTLLRLFLCAVIIIALAAPVWNPNQSILTGKGPVLLIMDNGWASGVHWAQNQETTLRLLREAENAGRPVALVHTAGDMQTQITETKFSNSAAILEKFATRTNVPIPVNHDITATVLEKTLQQLQPSSLIWLSDGLNHNGTKRLAQLIANIKPNQAVLYRSNPDGIMLLDSIAHDSDALTGRVVRADGASANSVEVVALDRDGRTISVRSVSLDAQQTSGIFRFDEPVKLRNEMAHIAIRKADNAGAVHLLDDRHRRRLIGLIFGQGNDLAQPLLSPLYYISRALKPFSDLRNAEDANLVTAIPELIKQNLSAIIMADIGTIPEKAVAEIREWVNNGGMLIRFAGPRLASSANDELLPVKLRHGDRVLGGALTWEQPKSIAPFESNSPFYGLHPPNDVVVNRQVLAPSGSGLE